MENFDTSNQQSIADFILRNVHGHKQFALATTDNNNRPWAVCVNLTFAPDCTVIWKSQKSTEHSQHIQARPDVAICIFSENDERGDFGLYAKATAHEITDEQELQECLAIRSARQGKPVPPLAEYQGDSPLRLYRAVMSEAWVNDDRHTKTKVDLDVLRQAAQQQSSANA